MKLSIFALTAILTSLAAANPILTPRAPSPSFKLYGDVGDVNLGLLTIIPITEPNKPVYYGFGWYGQGAQPIELFLQEESKRGRVLDLRQNGYEMYVAHSPPLLSPPSSSSPPQAPADGTSGFSKLCRIRMVTRSHVIVLSLSTEPIHRWLDWSPPVNSGCTLVTSCTPAMATPTTPTAGIG